MQLTGGLQAYYGVSQALNLHSTPTDAKNDTLLEILIKVQKLETDESVVREEDDDIGKPLCEFPLAGKANPTIRS